MMWSEKPRRSRSRLRWFYPIIGHWTAWRDLREKYGDAYSASRRYIYFLRAENLLLYFVLGLFGGYAVAVFNMPLYVWLSVIAAMWVFVGSGEAIFVRSWGHRAPRWLGWWRAQVLSKDDYYYAMAASLFHALASTLLGTFVALLVL